MIDLILTRCFIWIWLAPPCTSFSALQNGHLEGPWRSKQCPEGFGRPEVLEGNLIWERTLKIARVAHSVGVYFFIEHPLTSYAWRLPPTIALQKELQAFSRRVDLCMFSQKTNEVVPKKPLRIMYTAPWFGPVARKCDHSHWHSAHLCGVAAAKSASYPVAFARALAMAYASWRGA